MLLQGDSLAVQLFIGAAAISALSVAMTQAGWTHKWFVVGMFGLAAILAVASLGWPYFESRTPRISETLQAIVAARVAWFFSGAIPAIILGMRLSEFLRRRHTPKASVINWQPPLEALETFARPKFLENLSHLRGQISALDHESRKVDDRVSELKEAAFFDREDQKRHDRELVTEKAKQTDLSNRFRQAIEELENFHETLRADIVKKLREGHLIARGFRSPHTPTTPEVMIPMGEWRFLILDVDDDKALGPNFEYIALMIGRREN
jgi:hypothetical protein